MYRTPLLFRPTSVVLRSTALSIMESLIVATWFANGFSGMPRLANCTSPDLVFFNVSTFQLAPFLSASLASVKAFAPSFVPTYTYVWAGIIVSGAPVLLNAAPYTTLGITVEPTCKLLLVWLSTSKLILPVKVISGPWLMTTTSPAWGIITGPTGPAIATPAIDTLRQAVNNARFNIDCFIDILSFLY